MAGRSELRVVYPCDVRFERQSILGFSIMVSETSFEIASGVDVSEAPRISPVNRTLTPSPPKVKLFDYIGDAPSANPRVVGAG